MKHSARRVTLERVDRTRCLASRLVSRLASLRGRPRSRSRRPLLPALLALLALGWGGAAGQPLYELPQVAVRVTGDAIVLRGPAGELTYLQGLGWLEPLDAPPPQLVGDAVYGNAELAAALGIATPRLGEVRFGGREEVRVVLDLPELASSASLAALDGLQGRVAADEALTLTLPPLLLPAAPPEPYHGIDVSLAGGPHGTELTLAGPAMHYRVFTLDAPVRLVVDLVPAPRAPILESREQVAPGVVYRQLRADTPVGATAVHLLEVAPGAGEFRVVGASRSPMTTSQLAAGGIAAINGGYFDTATFDAIGLLRVDYGLVSLPSRNRAAVAFGGAAEAPTIDRVRARVQVRVDGRLLDAPAGALTLERGAGAWAGAPDKGVILLRGDRVLDNKVGPRQVPTGGAALVYDPSLRALALADAGDTLSVLVDMQPEAFDRARYALEAGPLLLKDGRVAYEPEREAFVRDQRILDAFTQQAAIGRRADDTVLLVVAEVMRAEDLVPLLQRLGAVDAMRLDSGSSTTLVVDGEVVNRSQERRVVTAIVLVPDALGARAPNSR